MQNRHNLKVYGIHLTFRCCTQHPQCMDNLYYKGDKYYSGYVTLQIFTRYWSKKRGEKDTIITSVLTLISRKYLSCIITTIIFIIFVI